MMSEGVQESLCSIFNPFECDFTAPYESAIQNGIAALQAQLVDDDKVSLISKIPQKMTDS